jgi:hypothetical protein
MLSETRSSPTYGNHNLAGTTEVKLDTTKQARAVCSSTGWASYSGARGEAGAARVEVTDGTAPRYRVVVRRAYVTSVAAWFYHDANQVMIVQCAGLWGRCGQYHAPVSHEFCGIQIQNNWDQMRLDYVLCSTKPRQHTIIAHAAQRRTPCLCGNKPTSTVCFV